jgi:uncharacterized damage-inducible protein DinB
MKRLFSVILVIGLIISHTYAQRKATTDTLAMTTVHGKDYMINYFQQTFDALKKSIDGLSTEQLQFKPAADKWSISQCLDHLVMTEKSLFDYAKEGMAKPANPERKKDVKVKDEEIIKGMNDRSTKAKAPENLIGTGTYTQSIAALVDIEKGREPILAYINEVTVDDLRSHVTDSFFGPVDAYHTLLYIAAHTSRHTAQINEVKADPNFPKQ